MLYQGYVLSPAQQSRDWIVEISRLNGAPLVCEGISRHAFTVRGATEVLAVERARNFIDTGVVQ